MDGVKLSTDPDNPEAVPYLLWDEPMSVAQLKVQLQTPSRAERTRLLAKILREAHDSDVWRFTTPDEVRQSWPEIRLSLGRRTAFWEFLLERWRSDGLIAQQTWAASAKIPPGILFPRPWRRSPKATKRSRSR